MALLAPRGELGERGLEHRRLGGEIAFQVEGRGDLRRIPALTFAVQQARLVLDVQLHR